MTDKTDPNMDFYRALHKVLGVSYVVEFEGEQYRFYSPEDVYNFEPVNARCTDRPDLFARLNVDIGWETDDIKVWREG